MNRYITLIASVLLAASCSGGSFLVETESFDYKGGWVLDHQAFEKIHSSYLLAHGAGVPVEDAVTHVSVDSPGVYYIYASTYNWTAPWYDGEGPGAFQIAVNDEMLPAVLGTEGDKWGWQYAGCVELVSGPNKLALHDLKGFEGRVDAIYFSKSQKAPSSDYLSLDRKRQQWTGKTGQRTIPGADLVVVGGGVAGCSAALTAAKYGLNVILIDNQPWLGGNSQLGVAIDGVGWMNLYPQLGHLTFDIAGLDPGRSGDTTAYWYSQFNGIGGINHKAYSDPYRQPVNDGRPSDILDPEKRIIAAGDTVSGSEEKEALELEYIRKNGAIHRERILREAGVRIYQNMQIYKVKNSGSEIREVIGKDLLTGEDFVFSGTLFADCTGDGTVGYLAGADYTIGREGKAFAGEPSAPDEPDRKMMGSSMFWYAFPRPDSGTFPTPAELPWVMQVDSASHVHEARWQWWWETGLEIDNSMESELVRDNMLRAIYGNWGYLKNFEPEFAGYRLDFVQHTNMKRESRRLLGDIILTENDIRQKKEFEDASFTSTWTMDLHYAQKKNAEKFPGWEWLTYCTNSNPEAVVRFYHIPYRCLYSRNIDNLFIGGRAMSVSHLALGTVRVQFTLGQSGEVTGIAAKICKEHGSLPRSVYTDYLDELKSCMKEGIPGYRVHLDEQ